MTVFELLSVIGAILLPVIGIAGALFRYAVSQKTAEFENTFRELAKKNEKQDDENKRVVERLHQQELYSQRLEGKLLLAESNSNGLIRDVEEIKDQMVTKAEFQTLQKTLNDALRLSTSPSQYRQPLVRSETPFPEGRGGPGGRR